MSRSVSNSAATKRRRSRGSLTFAIVFQAILLAGTLLVVVVDEPEPEPVTFQGKQSFQKTKTNPQQRKILDRYLRSVSKPRLIERLSVDASLSSDLPALPKFSGDAFSFQADDSLFMEEAASFLDQSSLLNIDSIIGSQSSTVSFFGARDFGKRIVIVVNTSASVVRKAKNKGVSIEAIQKEVASLIEGLESGTLFGVVQFSQGARRFAPTLAPAIAPNKGVALEWVEAELKGNPPVESEKLLGHEAGMALALEMDPDLIFLVTDGVLNRRERSANGYRYPEIPYEQFSNAISRGVRERGLRIKAHVIGFGLKEKDRIGMRALAKRFGGSLREF